jgi:hypothetical protein
MSKVLVTKRGDFWRYGFEGAKALAEYNEAGLHFTPSELSFHDFLDLMDGYILQNQPERSHGHKLQEENQAAHQAGAGRL